MIIKTRTIKIGRRNVEITAYREGEKCQIRVFEGKRPVSGINVEFDFDLLVDAEVQRNTMSLIDEAMDAVQSDLEQGRIQLASS